MTPVQRENDPGAQPHREALSAGIDGELLREELRFLLRTLDHDADLREVWARYHLVGDAVRKELFAVGRPDFATRVLAAIDHEQQDAVSLPQSVHAMKPALAPQVTSVGGASARAATDTTVGTRRAHYWLRWSGGGAIAAGVAVAALMLAQPGNDGQRASEVAGTPAQQATSASVIPLSQPTAPAAVPPWLSDASVSQYSQQASATIGGSYGEVELPYASSLSPWRVQNSRPAAQGDSGYLLMMTPREPSARMTRRAAAAQ